MPSPILLKTLPPIVQGANYARALQGINADGLAPTAANPSPFAVTDTLTATVSPGQGLPAIFAPAVAWMSAPLAQVILTIAPAQSAALAIDTPYLLEIFASHGGVGPWPLVAGYLQVLPSAGSQGAAAPPDLVTLPYAAQLLGLLSLSEAELEAVPTLITAASNAIRKHCARDFTYQLRTETCAVEHDGTIRLRNPPVSAVARIQCNPAVALTIGNSAATAAWVGATFSGNASANNLAITGLALNWEAGGVGSSQAVPFASLASPTIAALATAVSAVGSGWVGQADSQLGAWPVTELFDLATAQGAGPSDYPDVGARFRVYASDVNNAKPDPDDGASTGIWSVGRLISDLDARWGPDSSYWATDGPVRATVLISYYGGFSPIPPEIQWATVELVKVGLERLRTDLLLRSESAGAYSYTLGEALLDFMPRHVLQACSRYRLHWA